MSASAQLLALLKGGSQVAKAYKAHREDRKRERLQHVQAYLCSRVGDLEEKLRRFGQNPEKMDLFASTLEAPEQDDETLKTPFYAAFLERLLGNDEEPAHLLLVAAAMKQLAHVELKHFATQPATTYRVAELPDGIDVAYPSRIQNLALFYTGKTVHYGPRITSVGRLLQEILLKAEDSDIPA